LLDSKRLRTVVADSGIQQVRWGMGERISDRAGGDIKARETEPPRVWWRR
jgi:hypothetical protein